MNDQVFILSSLASILIGIVAAFLFAFGVIKIQSWLTRALVTSFIYALFLGVGILGGGGDPGFALPAPIIPTFVFSDRGVRLYNAIIPFLCWWTVFFTFHVVRRFARYLSMRKKG